MRLLCLFLFVSFSYLLGAQGTTLFSNSKAIDEHRYQGVKGSPYQYDHWAKARVFTLQGDAIKVDHLNINGYSAEIEIRQKDRFIELDQILYSRIEVEYDGATAVFVRNPKAKGNAKFVELIHEGIKMKCVRHFVVPMLDFEINNVGRTEKIKKFRPKFTYIFIKEGSSTEMAIKEKSLIAFLGFKKELGAIMSKSKFKKDKLSHLKEILALYETL